jgi:hypothetical protein
MNHAGPFSMPSICGTCRKLRRIALDRSVIMHHYNNNLLLRFIDVKIHSSYSIKYNHDIDHTPGSTIMHQSHAYIARSRYSSNNINYLILLIQLICGAKKYLCISANWNLDQETNNRCRHVFKQVTDIIDHLIVDSDILTLKHHPKISSIFQRIELTISDYVRRYKYIYPNKILRCIHIQSYSSSLGYKIHFVKPKE